MLCRYENQIGFEGRWGDRRAGSDFRWLLFLADDRSAFLSLGAICTDLVCSGDRRVCHRVDHFICRSRTIASVTSSTECFADPADHLTTRPSRQ